MPTRDRSYWHQPDALKRFFVRPIFLSLTIGIPFCAFKLIFGLSATRAWTPGFAAFGWIVIAWACADLAMNIGRSVYDLAGRTAPFEYCTIAQVGRMLGRPMVFLALDELLPTAKRYAVGHETVYGIVTGMAALALSLVLFR